MPTPVTQGGKMHLILMVTDEVGQLKVSLDGALESVSVNRTPDGTGHLYATFAPEVSREQIAAIIQEARQRQEEEQDDAGKPPMRLVDPPEGEADPGGDEEGVREGEGGEGSVRGGDPAGPREGEEPEEVRDPGGEG